MLRGPTVLLQWGCPWLIKDPTFDQSVIIYSAPSYSLRKTIDPANWPDALGTLNAVLLNHDHHVDKLDHAGRGLVNRTRPVFTTVAGASRLGGS